MTPEPDPTVAAAEPRRDLVLGETTSMAELQDVARLFESVWGRNAEGVPISSEMMRSLAHAGGLISVARKPDGELVGAAVLGRAEPGSCYGYIAAAARGVPDHGIGFALKQHQRSWALAHDLTVMRWTFDPLVSRNARFNLTKLGARAGVYVEGFYGHMDDALNGRDLADRLVPEWRLDAESVRAAALGQTAEPGEPSPSATGELGPDGQVAFVDADAIRWCRVPLDVVALRRTDPDQASRWRSAVRGRLTEAFADGFVAVGASRSGWYRLERESR